VTDAGRPGLLPGLYLFLAALWAGALAFFAAAAGIVLKTAPTRADGGVVNRALLDVLDVASIVLAALLLVLAAVLDRRRPWSRAARGLSIRLLVLAAVAAFVSLYLITPEMVALRAKAGSLFDSLPPSTRCGGAGHGCTPSRRSRSSSASPRPPRRSFSDSGRWRGPGPSDRRKERTHEGGPAPRIGGRVEPRRLVGVVLVARTGNDPEFLPSPQGVVNRRREPDGDELVGLAVDDDGGARDPPGRAERVELRERKAGAPLRQRHGESRRKRNEAAGRPVARATYCTAIDGRSANGDRSHRARTGWASAATRSATSAPYDAPSRANRPVSTP